MSDLPPVFVLYENPDWLPPLTSALADAGFPVQKRAVGDGIVDGTPDFGIYLNRMSPSSHTRGHHRSVPLTREILYWLQSHGARVVNGLRAFELEMSKMRQYRVLQRYGIRTPRTALAVGADHLVELADDFDGPFITKHNRGGKGLGIELFESSDQLAARLKGDFDFGPHDQVVIQQYIDAAQSHITRVEMVGGRMIFAMQSSTEDGFQLCPSDACQIEQADSNPEVCPADGSDADEAGDKFSPSPLSADDPLVARYRAMCAGEEIEIAGIEFVEDRNGRRYTYDINGTTNYNQSFGNRHGHDGMAEVAQYLRQVVVPQTR